MSLKDEFKKMIDGLTRTFSFPPITDMFIPPFHEGGQPKNAQFMALRLESGAAGISYVLLPDDRKREYTALQVSDYVGKKPDLFALEFGGGNPIKSMIRLAAVNALCQHVMKGSDFALDHVTDSLGLLDIREGDKVGMIGLFAGLVKTIRNAGAELVVIERNERLIKKNPDLTITRDLTMLGSCNKILCTGTTVLNNSLDEVLSHCSHDAFVAVVGPTVGYFPDPLFSRGVDVVGGRMVKDADLFFQRLRDGERWGDATQKTCFQKDTYTGIIS